MIISLCYLMLIVALAFSLKKLITPLTTFEENQVKNNVKLPEFTLCPYPGDKTYGNQNHSEPESFEDILFTLQNVVKKYNVWIGKDPTPVPRYTQFIRSVHLRNSFKNLPNIWEF